MGRNQVRALVMAICLVTGAGGCSAGHNPGTGNAGRKPGQASAPPDEGLVKDGYFVDAGGTATHFRVEVERVERLGDSSVLRFAVTLLDPEERSNLSEFGSDKIDSGFSGFHLIDPVGREYYSSLRQDDDQGDAFGSDHYGVTLNTGVRYEARVYYPALPESVQRVTVISPGTPSEFTGVPVTAAGPLPTPEAAALDSPSAGQTVVLPGTDPSGNVWRGGVQDLFDTVERPDRTTRAGAGQETEALRADVLFAFDSATLTPRAQSTLAEVATEIRSGADPARPITIVGHTDHRGTAGYNQSLSERRARAVADPLRGARQPAVHPAGVGQRLRPAGGQRDEAGRQRQPDGPSAQPPGRDLLHPADRGRPDRDAGNRRRSRDAGRAQRLPRRRREAGRRACRGRAADRRLERRRSPAAAGVPVLSGRRVHGGRLRPDKRG